MTGSDSPARLILRPISWAAVEAVTQGRRLNDWADDFPDEGDIAIAGMLQRIGVDSLDPIWGHHQIIERETGAVVGGAGFFGPPDAGKTEIGYGVVPSRQGRGYAPEAVRLLCGSAWINGAHELIANTDLDNPASQRVLEKAGFSLSEEDQQRTYSIQQPQSGSASTSE